VQAYFLTILKTSEITSIPIASLHYAIFRVQVVQNVIHIRDLIGMNANDGFVRITGNNALLWQLAVFHDDVNRWNSVAGLAVRIDLKTWLGANIVIKGQDWQEFKLVDDTSDTLDVHGGSLSANYQRGQLNLAVS
jgi:hypothetical protein